MSGGQGGAGQGGAIYVAGGKVTLTSATVTNDSVQGGTGGTGPVVFPVNARRPGGTGGNAQGGCHLRGRRQYLARERERFERFSAGRRRRRRRATTNGYPGDGGNAQGGAIYLAADLTLTGGTLSNDSAQGRHGNANVVGTTWPNVEIVGDAGQGGAIYVATGNAEITARHPFQ